MEALDQVDHILMDPQSNSPRVPAESDRVADAEDAMAQRPCHQLSCDAVQPFGNWEEAQHLFAIIRWH